MCCPTDRNIAICDNYPDKLTHCRTLFFYDFEKNERTNLGTFRMSDEQPVTDNFIQFSQGVDLEIMKLFSPSLFSFTRSGLHCDLHPRWDANGKWWLLTVYMKELDKFIYAKDKKACKNGNFTTRSTSL